MNTNRSIFVVFVLLCTQIFVASPCYSAEGKIKITVLEEGTNEPVPFASISRIEGNKITPISVTDINGECYPEGLVKNTKLKISCVGYTSTEVKVNKNKGQLDIHLNIGILLHEISIRCFETTMHAYAIRCGYTNCTLHPVATRGDSAKVDSIIKKQIEPENENLTVYPNPAVSNVYLRSNVLKYSLEIFDTSGKLILSIVEFSDNNTLNLEDLKPGTYIARITSGKNMKTARFVKN